MTTLLGLIAFGAGYYCCYKAIEYFRYFNNGISTTATVRDIEKAVEVDDEGNTIIRYWLQLNLPDYYGWELGKKYEKPVDPHRYFVGEQVAIWQNKQAPTDILIKKELRPWDTPTHFFLFALILFVLSYVCFSLMSK